jgi:hypothetical protein
MDEKLKSLYLQADAASALIDKEAELIQNLDVLKSYCKRRQDAFIHKRAQILAKIEVTVNSIITSN